MAKQITTEEVKAKIDSGKHDYYLVDVLMQNSFEGQHVPTSESVPYQVSFVKEFEKTIKAPKDKDVGDIVVVCLGKRIA